MLGKSSNATAFSYLDQLFVVAYHPTSIFYVRSILKGHFILFGLFSRTFRSNPSEFGANYLLERYLRLGIFIITDNVQDFIL